MCVVERTCRAVRLGPIGEDCNTQTLTRSRVRKRGPRPLRLSDLTSNATFEPFDTPAQPTRPTESKLSGLRGESARSDSRTSPIPTRPTDGLRARPNERPLGSGQGSRQPHIPDRPTESKLPRGCGFDRPTRPPLARKGLIVFEPQTLRP